MPNNEASTFVPMVRSSRIQILTPIKNGRQLIGGSINGQPLIHVEDGLGTSNVGPSGCNLDVAAAPAGVVPGPVGGEVEAANRGINARTGPAEQVEVAAFKVVVGFAHQAPRFEIWDPQRSAGGVADLQADLGVRAGFDDGPRFHVEGVHAVVLANKIICSIRMLPCMHAWKLLRNIYL